MNLDNLSAIERETARTPNRRMFGAVPSLRNKGLVEVFKKYTSIFRRKKKKFVKIRNNKNFSEDK